MVSYVCAPNNASASAFLGYDRLYCSLALHFASHGARTVAFFFFFRSFFLSLSSFLLWSTSSIPDVNAARVYLDMLVALSLAALTALIMAFRSPLCSKLLTASIVVPPGEQTAS